MSYTIDVRWLLLLPLGSILVFVCWVLWNISHEIWAKKRRWTISYRDSGLRTSRVGRGR